MSFPRMEGWFIGSLFSIKVIILSNLLFVMSHFHKWRGWFTRSLFSVKVIILTVYCVSFPRMAVAAYWVAFLRQGQIPYLPHHPSSETNENVVSLLMARRLRQGFDYMDIKVRSPCGWRQSHLWHGSLPFDKNLISLFSGMLMPCIQIPWRFR